MDEAASAEPVRSFEVSKDNLRHWRWHDDPTPDPARLEADQILVEVQKFALTSNNITYARLGEPIAKTTTISYWRFFPAAEGWGSIPVWGVGQVIASRNADIRPGEHVYGFFPMATHLVMNAKMQDAARLVDDAPHRRDLPAIYQDYVLIDRDERFHHMGADAYLLVRPAFSLSFCCAFFLQTKDYFGATRIIISSASSKVSLGLCHLLVKHRPPGLDVCGLTSAANAEIVSDRGEFDRVYTYDKIEEIPVEGGTVFIDVSGDGRVRARIHHQLGDTLVYSCLAGFTHWEHVTDLEEPLPGPTPELFSTPAHMVTLRNAWGVEGYWERFTLEYDSFLAYMTPWFKVDRRAGKRAVESAYGDVLDGMISPDVGCVLSIDDDAGRA